jgi:hypothetical protein
LDLRGQAGLGLGVPGVPRDLLLVVQAVVELIWGIREAAMEDHRIVFEACAIFFALQTDEEQSEYLTPEDDICRSA